jgi:hypothetical protein
VPEAGQGEQIQREEVSGLWGTLKIWMMPTREMISSAPTKGDMGCGWPKRGKQVTKGDDKKGNVMTRNKGICTINNE